MGARISVISATRNAASTIGRLHDSLSKQLYSDFEWIVADGASTDATVELLRVFSAKSSWMRFFSEPDFGVYHALNKAINIATGQYYVVIGADDFLAKDALLNFSGYIQEHCADVVFARVMRAGKMTGGFFPKRAWIGTARVFATSHSCGTFFRTALHQKYGLYSSRFPLLADVFFLKTLFRSGSVKFADAEFVAGTFAEGGMTTVNKLQILAENWQIQMLTERFPLFQTLLFFGKVAARYPALAKELRAARQYNRSG